MSEWPRRCGLSKLMLTNTPAIHMNIARVGSLFITSCGSESSKYMLGRLDTAAHNVPYCPLLYFNKSWSTIFMKCWRGVFLSENLFSESCSERQITKGRTLPGPRQPFWGQKRTSESLTSWGWAEACSKRNESSDQKSYLAKAVPRPEWGRGTSFPGPVGHLGVKKNKKK